ncbi:hypothetical protein J2T13_005284 [Paenibacillus sp. DS2015]|uniref:hypothetical protein n=1 Tax=Paenibacillus sp. DS2015 TaxID=3373917 RepID=UPI003D1BCF7D
MKKWITYSVVVLLIISVIINISFYRDKVSKEKEYFGAFASAIDTTNSTLENLKTTENKQTYLYHLLQSLEKMDSFFMLSPSDTYYDYFKYYKITVIEVLTNPDLEFKFEYFSALQHDMNLLNDMLFENYVLKVDSFKEFEEILLSVILENEEFF